MLNIFKSKGNGCWVFRLPDCTQKTRKALQIASKAPSYVYVVEELCPKTTPVYRQVAKQVLQTFRRL